MATTRSCDGEEDASIMTSPKRSHIKLARKDTEDDHIRTAQSLSTVDDDDGQSPRVASVSLRTESELTAVSNDDDNDDDDDDDDDVDLSASASELNMQRQTSELTALEAVRKQEYLINICMKLFLLLLF